MVGPCRDISAQDRHQQDRAGEQQARRLGRGDTGYGGENDVRPAAERDGIAEQRRAEEDGYVEEVPGAAPGDGLLAGKDGIDDFTRSGRWMLWYQGNGNKYGFMVVAIDAMTGPMPNRHEMVYMKISLSWSRKYRLRFKILPPAHCSLRGSLPASTGLLVDEL